jgi:hypothetical protein
VRRRCFADRSATHAFGRREKVIQISRADVRTADQIFTLSLPIDSQPFPYHDANAISGPVN